MSTDKKIAVVTGASRGIGKAIAEQLGQHFFVIGTATSEEGAARITENLNGTGVEGIGLPLNVNDDDSLRAFIASVAQHGAPFVLVNNAGVTRDNILLRMKQEEWDQVIDTNLTAVFKLAKAFLKGMTKAREGRIINISSVVGSMGNAGQANYAATKAAVGGFGRSLAREVGSRNITVNTVAPGFIDTDMTQAIDEASRKTLLESIPLDRMGSSSEIAQAVAFLAGPAGGYITGQTLVIDGGLSL